MIKSTLNPARSIKVKLGSDQELDAVPDKNPDPVFFKTECYLLTECRPNVLDKIKTGYEFTKTYWTW